MRHVRLLAGALLALTTTLLPLIAPAADPPNPAARRAHPARPPFPQLTLPAVAQGARAVELLGSQLAAVAAWYGKSAEELAALLVQDNRLRVDRHGRLFVVDTLETPIASVPADQRTVLDGTLLPLDQTFKLHSRPGAKRTIYLNFRGATLSSTAWNGGSGTITAQPFDLDNAPYSFSTSELQRIQYIWQRVAEDFAPMDVNVTTEQPAPETLTRSSGSDQIFGTTVLITNSAGVYSCSCGGVAYVGVFDDTTEYYKPALVFYNQLGAGNEKYVAEAISHEAGHNVGLLHDGTSGTGYYQGQGSGATGWAPIMGVGYYRSLVQWSKGEYSDANNTQDDFKVMETYGAPIRLDDHGDLPGNATVMTGTTAGGTTTFVETGVIERAGDVDQFAFAAAAGTLTVQLQPASRSANLDARIELRDAAGKLLASANPLDALAASLSVNAAQPGTYYVSVSGTGKGDPLVDGYTAYGSVGNYALTVSASTSTGTPPVAVLGAVPTSGTVPLTVSFSAAGSSDPDGTITAYDWVFGDGSTGTGASLNHIYNTAGTFTAQLRVTDNMGLSASKTVDITVNPVVAIVKVHVADIAMSISPSGKSRWRAVAAVRVVDSAGKAVPGATVSGSWSGLIRGTASGTTGSDGLATFQSGTTSKSGAISFQVTGVTLSGYEYDASANVETSDSISR